MSGEVKKTGGVPSRSALYAKVAPYAEEAILKLVELMRCGNPAVEMGAAKVLLAKTVPDLKAMEVKIDPESAPLGIIIYRPEKLQEVKTTDVVQ